MKTCRECRSNPLEDSEPAFRSVKKALSDFAIREYGTEDKIDFSNLSRVDFVYGEAEDGQEIEVYADLKNLQIVTLLSKKVFDTLSYQSLKDLSDAIDCSCFDSFIGDVDSILALADEYHFHQ